MKLRSRFGQMKISITLNKCLLHFIKYSKTSFKQSQPPINGYLYIKRESMSVDRVAQRPLGLKTPNLATC